MTVSVCASQKLALWVWLSLKALWPPRKQLRHSVGAAGSQCLEPWLRIPKASLTLCPVKGGVLR